tara:strand:+ start:49444 stop:49590 length:147 start_codon:yes stop_codon:yes gene_type:complete
MKGTSGLDLAVAVAHRIDTPIMHFDIDDIVRSGICKDIVIALCELGEY